MPTESTLPRLEIPNVDLWAFLFEREDRPYPDNKVIYTNPDTSRSYTYAQVHSTALDFGKGLKSEWNWQKGDVLALYTPNCIDTPAIIWGTHWAGGVVSPANPGYTSDELAFQLKDARAKALVTQTPFLKAACEAAKKAGVPEDRIILLGEKKDEIGKFKHFSDIKHMSGLTLFKRAKADPRTDLAFLVYSSGTTGLPKGVMLSHKNIIANIMMVHASDEGNLSWRGGKDGKGDKHLAILPFFHIYGLACLIHQSIYSGLQLIVMPKFDLESFCKHAQNYSTTFAYVVPPVVLLLGKSPIVDKYDMSSIKMMTSGAAPLASDLVDVVYKRLKIPIRQGFGLSETVVTHIQPWEDWNKTIGSVGRLLPNQVAKYMSNDGQEVPTGQTGELWIKGPSIFLGYLNNAEGSRNAKKDGYFKTGDVGYQDAKGNFYITDRMKELIKYKGFQVPPAALEGILATHDEVDDVAVIGIYKEDQATEVPRAYVVLKKGLKAGRAMEERIVHWLATKVASHKRLRGGVKFVDEIPKSTSGKILRRVLKEQATIDEKSQRAKL